MPEAIRTNPHHPLSHRSLLQKMRTVT